MVRRLFDVMARPSPGVSIDDPEVAIGVATVFRHCFSEPHTAQAGKCGLFTYLDFREVRSSSQCLGIGRGNPGQQAVAIDDQGGGRDEKRTKPMRSAAFEVFVETNRPTGDRVKKATPIGIDTD